VPEISVIITTYNRAQLLEQAIESVLAQSYKNFEVIVVDDGSEDETSRIVKRFKVKYIFQKNSGISKARNTGVEFSKGRLIAFLDSDDLWKPEKLKIQKKFMDENPHIPLCYTDEIWLKGRVLKNQKKIHQKFGGDIFERSLKLCIISPSSVMIRREIFEEFKFDEKLPVCEDYDLWLRICAKYEVGYIPQKLIIKRSICEQLSKKYKAMDRFRIYAIRKILKTHISFKKRRLALEELRTKCRIVANGALKRGKFFRFLKYKLIPLLAK